MQKEGRGDLMYLIYLLLCPYHPMPHGNKISCRQLCKYVDGRLGNNHFFCGLLQQVWILATWCIPSRTKKEDKLYHEET